MQCSKSNFSSYITNLQIALSFVYFCTAHYILLTVKSFTEQSPYNSVHFSFLLSAQSIYPHYTTIIKRHGQARPEHPKKSTISNMPFSIAPPISPISWATSLVFQSGQNKKSKPRSRTRFGRRTTIG